MSKSKTTNPSAFFIGDDVTEDIKVYEKKVHKLEADIERNAYRDGDIKRRWYRDIFGL